MKLKNLKMKHIVALALALFMVLPALLVGVHATYPASGTAPYLDVVPTGGAANTSGSPYTMPAQAVGTTFSVDVRVDNYADVNQGGTNNGVSGVSYFVNWNPAVLTFVSYTDVTWLPDQQDLGDVIPSTNTGQLQVGQIVNGGDGQLTADSLTGSVSSTITFTVAAPGSYTISISNTGAPYIYAPQAPPSTTSTGVTGTIPVYGAQYTAAMSLSLYKSGTTASSFEFPSGTNPIGNTFSVDVYISNPNAVPIWAWNVGVTWNPAAIQLTNIVEGTYLSQTSPTGNQQNSVTLFAPGWADNGAGDIPQGISDVYLSYTTQTAFTGVLATLTFTVINYASSTISLTQGIPTLETLTTSGTAPNIVYTPTAVSPAPALNSFQYTTQSPPAAQSPVANIVNENPQSPYQTGQVTTLSGASSTGGSDPLVNPASPNLPIVSYTWSVSPAFPSGSTALPTTGTTILFTAPTVQTETTYTITLTVATATTSDPSYVNTGSTTIQLTVQAPLISPTNAGPVVDCFIYNNIPPSTTLPNKAALGYGSGACCDAFGPQELMQLGAYVTYNGGSVADKPVTWVIQDSTGNVIATVYGTTNSNGYADYSYQLPWYVASGSGDSNNVGDFGTWTVTASSEVSQTFVSDVMPFQFNYLVTLNSVTPTLATVARETSVSGASNFIPTVQGFTVSLTNVADQTETVYITYTIFDAQNVPIATGLATTTVAAATYSGSPLEYVSPTTVSYTVSNIPIPAYAFVGTDAKIVVNIFNANPLNTVNNAVSFSPQVTSPNFTIAMETGSQPTQTSP